MSGNIDGVVANTSWHQDTYGGYTRWNMWTPTTIRNHRRLGSGAIYENSAGRGGGVPLLLSPGSTGTISGLSSTRTVGILFAIDTGSPDIDSTTGNCYGNCGWQFFGDIQCPVGFVREYKWACFSTCTNSSHPRGSFSHIHYEGSNTSDRHDGLGDCDSDGGGGGGGA